MSIHFHEVSRDRIVTRRWQNVVCRTIATLALCCTGYGALADEPAKAVDSCHRYDRFVLLGSEDAQTLPCMTIAPELGGLRAALADAGFGFSAFAGFMVNYDMRTEGGSPQVYGGQLPTYTATFSPVLTYDLSRLGLNEGSQFVLKTIHRYNSYKNNGVTGSYFDQVSVRLPFWNNRVIVQGGYYHIGAQFYGSSIGDISGASVLGSNSSMLFQTGMSGWLPTPAIDIRFQTPDGRLYNHIGFSRSLSPRGPFYEWDHNRTGLRFDLKDSKLAVIDEIGYRLPSAPGQHKIWLRAGALYNTTDYSRIDLPLTKEDNFGFYGILDYQLTQPDLQRPFRGWYVNVKGNYGNPSLNSFAYDVGATLYNVGPFQSRPLDLFAVSIGRNFISGDAVDLYRKLGADPVTAITTMSTSYALQVTRGVYWNNTLAYTSSPTVVPKHQASVNILSSVTFGF